MYDQEQQRARQFNRKEGACPRTRTKPDNTMPLECTVTDDYGDWGHATIVENGRKKQYNINEIRVRPDVFNGRLLLSFFEGEHKLVRQLDIPFENLRTPMDRYQKADTLAREYEEPGKMPSSIVVDTVYDFRGVNALLGRGRIDQACAEEKILLSDRMSHALFGALSNALEKNHTGMVFS